MLPIWLVLIVQASIYIGIAPGIIGMLTWFRSRLQARRGADILQPYRDLNKLQKKQANLPEAASWLFTISPYIVFACYLLLGMFLPTLFLGDDELGMDFFFVVYLLGLARFVTGLAAFDVGEPFGTMSNSRQFFIHILAEPVLFATIYTLALNGQSSNIAKLVATRYDQAIIGAAVDLVIVLGIVSLTLIFLAESGRLPFDNPHTHLELTMIEHGAHLAYSGHSLALMEWAQAMRFTFFLSLLATLAWPWSAATEATVPALAWALAIFLLKLIFLLFMLALWEITQVKLRLRRIVNPLIIALGVGLLGIIFTVATHYPVGR